jgi:glycosyltransferase involved in cell wall biosynthesis
MAEAMHTLCFCNSNRAWGGGEQWHFQMARRLHEQGYGVQVITPGDSPLLQRVRQNGLPVYSVNITNLSFLNGLKIARISHILRTSGIHAIFLNLPADAKTAGIAAKLAGVRQIIYRRGTALPVCDTVLNRWLFRRVFTHIIANSEEIKRLILHQNPRLIAADKIRIVYNGIDVAAHDQHDARPLYTKQADELVLGNAGRLVEQKGQQALIELGRVLKTRGLRFKLLIAGVGPLRERLQQQIVQQDVQQEVELIGFVENMKGFFNSLDLFVCSSQHEGSTHVLLEAMTAGKPVVAFNLSSIPELVMHEQTGLLVESGDIAGLAYCVTRLARDISTRQQFGRNARRRVERHFTIQQSVTQIINLIEHDGTAQQRTAAAFSGNHYL